MLDSRIMELANKHLDQGLCFSRTTRIIRATEAEIISFAKALISETENNVHGQAVENFMLEKHPNAI